MIRIERRDGVSVITIDRPDRMGALNRTLRLEMGALVEAEVLDPEVSGLVLTGIPGQFCAGGDVTEMGQGAHTLASARALLQRSSQRIIRALYKADKPVVAAVDGPAAGFGWSLALASDHVIATPRARFSIAFARVGLVPDGAAIYLLRERVGEHRTKQIILRARSFTADEAERLGLADEIHEGDDLVAHAVDTVRAFNTPSPLACALSKQLVRMADDSLDNYLRAELLSVPQGMVSEEHRLAAEALRAKMRGAADR